MIKARHISGYPHFYVYSISVLIITGRTHLLFNLASSGNTCLPVISILP